MMASLTRSHCTGELRIVTTKSLEWIRKTRKGVGRFREADLAHAQRRPKDDAARQHGLTAEILADLRLERLRIGEAAYDSF
jgi:hypothetical protein